MYTRLKETLKALIPKDNPVYNFVNGFRKRPLNPFRESGFHGDPHLTDLMFHCLGRSEQFIETGASVGASLVHVASSFPAIDIYSCEPDVEAYAFTSAKVAAFKNVTFLKKTSPEFLYAISKMHPGISGKETVFWLDSHGMGFKWPLRDEVTFATTEFRRGYLFIDDFQVPDHPQFGYSTYDNQICSFDYIKRSLNPNRRYTIYQPSYASASGLYDPLRGWILIDFGHDAPLNLPVELKDKVSSRSF